ncbi:hypothetical protein Q3G72_012729 [Acer saccharum]|nr:hypothetical protein Q3G72_012729 [Acer saccharum]
MKTPQPILNSFPDKERLFTLTEKEDGLTMAQGDKDLKGNSVGRQQRWRGGEIFVPKNIGIGKELDKSNKLPCELVVSNGAASKSHSVIEDQMGPLMDFNNSVDNQLGQEGQVGLSPSGRIVAGYESSLKEI